MKKAKRAGFYGMILLGVLVSSCPLYVWASEENSERLYTQGLNPFYEKDYERALSFFQQAVDEEHNPVFLTPDSSFSTELDQSLFPETLRREFENNKQPFSKLRFHANDKDKNLSAQLDKQIFPDALRNEFSKKQLSFSGPVSVEVAREHVWRIKSTGQTCFIIHQNGELYVYCPDGSDKVIVTVKEANRQWQLKATGKTYRIIKENDQLNVYEPPYYQAIYYLGITYGKLGLYAEAVSYLERFLELMERSPTPRPGFISAHLDLAVAYSRLERYEDARLILDKVESVDSRDGRISDYYQRLIPSEYQRR